MEQAERVRTLIATGGFAAAGPYSPSTLPELVEENDSDAAPTPRGAADPPASPSRSAASSAARAAAAATVAAATAAALASPHNRRLDGRQSEENAASVMGMGGSGGAIGKSGWGDLGRRGERDSDCMSCDTSVSNQALLPPGIRCVLGVGGLCLVGEGVGGR